MTRSIGSTNCVITKRRRQSINQRNVGRRPPPPPYRSSLLVAVSRPNLLPCEPPPQRLQLPLHAPQRLPDDAQSLEPLRARRRRLRPARADASPQGRSIQANVGVEFKGVSWS